MENDDAGGGRRGTRAVWSPDLAASVREAYGLTGVEDATDLGGSCSLNALVRDGALRVVVRVYRPCVTEARLDAIDTARRALAAHGIPWTAVVPTRSGARRLRHRDRQVEVERYVEHDANMESWQDLEAVLPLLGRMHAVLHDVSVGADGRRPVFANHVESWDAVERTRVGARRMRAWADMPGALQLADAAEELASAVARAEADLVRRLPRQLVHGDFWDNNVLFRDGRVVLVADFDFMGERARVDDLALTLYYSCLKFWSSRVPDHGLVRLRRLVDAYEAGLGEPLTTDERAALPLAVARQPLWSIGGWVALLDHESVARGHAAGCFREVGLARDVMRDLGRWQAALA